MLVKDSLGIFNQKNFKGVKKMKNHYSTLLLVLGALMLTSCTGSTSSRTSNAEQAFINLYEFAD